MTRWSEITVAAICTAIEEYIGIALVTSGDLVQSQNYDELTEGINDPRVLQVYPEASEPISDKSEIQQQTLGTDPVIAEAITIHADYYARQRSHIGEDMSQLVSGIDAIRASIKAQACDNFGIDIKEFQWRWERVTFEYGSVQYAGARFYITVRIY
jgi:hypothetical protein